MSSSFVDGLDSFGRKDEGHSFLKFRNIHSLLLEVWVLSFHPCRVELGSTSSVGVASSHY